MSRENTIDSFTLIGIAGVLLTHQSVRSNAQQVTQKPTQDNIPAEVRFLAAGIQDARERLQCAQATVTSVEETPWEVALVNAADEEPHKSLKDTVSTTNAKWYYQKPKLSLLVEPDVSDNTIGEISERLVDDGTHIKYLQTYRTYVNKNTPNSRDARYRYLGLLNYSESAIKNGLWASHKDLDPRYYAYCPLGEPLDQTLLQTDNTPIAQGKEAMGGSQCMKVQFRRYGSKRIVCWLDLEHNFLLRRMEVYGTVSKQMVLESVLAISRLQESHGIWMPALAEIKQFSFLTDVPEIGVPIVNEKEPEALNSERIKTEGHLSILPPAITRIKISNFLVDGTIPPAAFTLEWPVGSTVQDRMLEREFIVPQTATASGRGSNDTQLGGTDTTNKDSTAQPH